MKRYTFYAALCLLPAVAFAYTQVYNVTSADNQKKRYGLAGTAGGSLPNIGTALEANTACEATISDYGAATDATADLSCANTGEVVVSGYSQASVEALFTRDSGTVVNMQCDTSSRDNESWKPIFEELPNGEKKIRTWIETTSVSTRLDNNFNINADLMRCRWWVTDGTTLDFITPYVRLAR